MLDSKTGETSPGELNFVQCKEFKDCGGGKPRKEDEVTQPVSFFFTEVLASHRRLSGGVRRAQ